MGRHPTAVRGGFDPGGPTARPLAAVVVPEAIEAPGPREPNREAAVQGIGCPVAARGESKHRNFGSQVDEERSELR